MTLTYPLIATILLLVFVSADTQGIRGARDDVSVQSSNTTRTLDESDPKDCIGGTLRARKELHVGECMSAKIDGEMTYLAIKVYPDHLEPGYTLYRPEIWSEKGTYSLSSIGRIILPEDAPAPYLRLQGDGHLVFAGNISSTAYCRAKPNKRGRNMKAILGGPLPYVLRVQDNDGDVIWTMTFHHYEDGTSGVNEGFDGDKQCYGNTETKCVSALKEKKRLTWDEYICEKDSSGKVVARFGLDLHGKLGLWRGKKLVWRLYPLGDGAKGDWLHLQRDGKLVFYEGKVPNLKYEWKSQCKGDDTEITINDGDVQQFDGNGSLIWELGGKSPEPVCFDR